MLAMNTIGIAFKRVGVVWALVSLAIWMAACAPLTLTPGESEPSSSNVITQGYPAPGGTVTPAPLPTLLGGTPNVVVALVPDERVVVASVSELPPEATPPSRYSVETEAIGGDTLKPALYVVDSQTGNRVRLGDDSGATRFGAMSDKYVVWYFLCDPCPNTGLGLYAYNLHTGENVLIATKFVSAINAIKISNQWATYLGSVSHSAYIYTMYAYHLITGETVLIADDVVSPGSRGPIYSSVNENKIAWLAADPTKFGLSLKVYDFATQTTSLPIQPQTFSAPRDLSVSRNLIMWREGGWWGYDLTREALFTIPVVPPGWDATSIQNIGPVTAQGSQLFWMLEVGGQTHHFTAPVTERGPQPTFEPTVPPATAVPTSYP
jgi:hypothetical protein